MEYILTEQWKINNDLYFLTLKRVDMCFLISIGRCLWFRDASFGYFAVLSLCEPRIHPAKLKMGMGRPGPGLGPGPMASRPILGVMGRPISPWWPIGYYGRTQIFFYNPKPWILWTLLEKIRFKINIYHNNMLRLLAMHQIKHIY